ncbi:ferric reductase-like transmembrane domain-containing protein [Hoeflea sp. YIM 152468]|uniref:ferric reductase-like transmembrane domain-containing protein n=1 Tax=Hoeflea sp. YIM 152468 TaxID=3031759 RepID=UPI0023DA3433|nr:ferric reductase-like transmembrane domain-containing protein [Hoeflea sp. YIM 152468]MDF1607824.1 ferric reductase-like transmembrane domain-containing protein [Hoeflea sp. YIM 152468]
MSPSRSGRARKSLIWVVLAIAVVVPLGAAAMSPLLAWRDPVYIAAGFAGVFALAVLLVQPLLAAGSLPDMNSVRSKRAHRWIGGVLVAAVVAHVAGLWITSPPDVVDALLFRSPTPFSAWGVIAMWAVFGTALIAVFRPRLRCRPRAWRHVHMSLALVIAVTSVVHAVLIEGTMEFLSKVVLCAMVVAVTVKVVARLWGWAGGSR